MNDGTKRLIVNADDLGRSPGINRGIIQAHRDGIVTSTTLMVNLEGAEEAFAAASACELLGIGLHVNLCYGPALSPDVNSLTGPDGNLERDLNRLSDRINPIDVDRETRAQLEKFRELAGRWPTHLDSHHHLLSWPACREPLIHIATEFDLPVRCELADLKAQLLQHQIPTTDHFEARFHGPGNTTVDRLLDILDSLGPGTTELMCHPGLADQLHIDSAYTTEREAELSALIAPEVRKAIADNEIQLVNFTVFKA